jgi:hypothetical protein
MIKILIKLIHWQPTKCAPEPRKTFFSVVAKFKTAHRESSNQLQPKQASCWLSGK